MQLRFRFAYNFIADNRHQKRHKRTYKIEKAVRQVGQSCHAEDR